MLIEFVPNKKIEELKIGQLYRTRPDRRLLSPDKIIEIKNINEWGEVTYIYITATRGNLYGNFHRTQKEILDEIILEPLEEGV
jgi:hypothetical protein